MNPYFFEPELEPTEEYTLSAATSRHCTTVLRMQSGAALQLVDGRGLIAQAQILTPHKDKCRVHISSLRQVPQRSPQLALAVAFTKNRSRVEWMVEKITEIGCDVLIPLHCQRSERDKINPERLTQIMASAMIQSQQAHLPDLMAAQAPAQALRWYQDNMQGNILIAHCEEQSDKNKLNQLFITGQSSMVMIGPEGDFSPSEINDALHSGAMPISLGPNRLRTETAAIYACSTFNQFHYG